MPFPHGAREELRPDLILLDIALPSMNGLEVARQILKLSPNSKILFVSQESSAEVVREALGTGAHGFVVKIDAGSELLILNVGQNKAENRIVVVSRSQTLEFSGQALVDGSDDIYVYEYCLFLGIVFGPQSCFLIPENRPPGDSIFFRSLRIAAPSQNPVGAVSHCVSGCIWRLSRGQHQPCSCGCSSAIQRDAARFAGQERKKSNKAERNWAGYDISWFHEWRR